MGDGILPKISIARSQECFCLPLFGRPSAAAVHIQPKIMTAPPVFICALPAVMPLPLPTTTGQCHSFPILATTIIGGWITFSGSKQWPEALGRFVGHSFPCPFLCPEHYFIAVCGHSNFHFPSHLQIPHIFLPRVRDKAFPTFIICSL